MPTPPINTDAYGPLYSRIAMLMRQRILGGVWPARTQIPTLEVLMAEFGASRVTLRLALDLLERDGLIERFRGRGTFVTARAAGKGRIRLGQSWRGLVEALKRTRPRLLETVDDVLPPGGDTLDAELAGSYCCLKRVHLLESVPYAVMHLYIDNRYYEGAAARFRRELVIPVLQSLPGLTIGRAHQTLTIGCAEPEIADALQIPMGVPVGMLRRVICDDANVAVYVGDLTYRGDMIEMQVNLDLEDQE